MAITFESRIESRNDLRLSVMLSETEDMVHVRLNNAAAWPESGAAAVSSTMATATNRGRQPPRNISATMKENDI